MNKSSFKTHAPRSAGLVQSSFCEPDLKQVHKKILIFVGGGKNHLKPFLVEGRKLGLNVVCASFSELAYFLDSSGKPVSLKIDGYDLKNFDLIYIRLVGRRFEDVSIVADYAHKNRIKLVDSRLPLTKGLETKLLYEASLPVPKTFFSSVLEIAKVSPRIFGFPFVIKSTTGKQGHGVWSPENMEELKELASELKEKEDKGGRFISQEFIKAGVRIRVFVVGGKAKAGLVRPTKWWKRFRADKPEKSSFIKVPLKYALLAEKAIKALGIDVAGVDILQEDSTGKLYVLEVNSAPRWESIKKDTGLNVEAEILKFLSKLQ